MSEPLASQLALGGYLLGRARATPARDAALARWLAGERLLALVEAAATPGVVVTPVHGDAVLDGHAGAVLDAGLADVLIVAARQHDDVPAYYLVEASADGVTRRAQRAADGRDFADVELRGVRVGASERLELASAACDEAHGYFALLLASESLGIMHALVRLTAEHLAQREQFGRKLIDFQVLQHRLVDMQLETVRAESMLEIARYHCDGGDLGASAGTISAAFYQTARSGRRVAEEAVQLHGAIGMTEELVIGHYLKRIITNSIVGGHAEAHLERAADARGIFPQPQEPPNRP
jgi:alkylation response protein AidB-like acyl-CoA dehydrogenase